MSEEQKPEVIKAIEAYCMKREDKEAAKAVLSTCEESFRKSERALVEAMMQNDVRAVKDQQGRTFSLSAKCFMSLTLGNKDKVLAFLEGRGHEHADLVREEIVKTRAQELIREIYKKEGKDGLPECLKFDDSPGITVRGWKGEKGGADESSAA